MGKRRQARERALQALYELEFNDASLDVVLTSRDKDAAADGDIRVYAERLLRGVTARREELDSLIQGTSRNWRVARMTPVDRNILRLAVFEMLEETKFLPPAIIINEAIEIAKRWSGDEAAVFINGVLDAVRKKIRPDESPKKVNHHEPREKSPAPFASRRPAERGVRRTEKRSGDSPGRKA